MANSALKRKPVQNDDYELKPIDLQTSVRVKANDKDLKEGHLFENRAITVGRQNVCEELGPRAVAVFNIPQHYTETQVRAMFAGSNIENLHLKTNTRGFTSHAIIEFHEESHAAEFVRDTKGKWEGVNLLRVETHNSAVKESYDQRTVVVGNLPTALQVEELEDRFSHFGNILRIELP